MTPLVKCGAVLALLAGLVVSLLAGAKAIDARGYQRAQAEATAALEAQKLQATQVLATETAKARAAEVALATFKSHQDTKDAQAQSTIQDLSRRVRNLADPAGRLRDPHAPGCGGGGGGTTPAAAPAAGDSPADPAQAGGLLSVQLFDLLQSRLQEADVINLAYASCRAEAYQVRALQPP